MDKEAGQVVRGTHKQMVVVKMSDSRYYEQAYFVLRDGHMLRGDAEQTMMAEANRILDESMLMPQPRKRARRLSRWGAFALGVAAGAAVMLVLVLAV